MFADKNDGSNDGEEAECGGNSYSYHSSGNTIYTNRYTDGRRLG